ncbi:DUF3343 domain-containing protein [Clostridium thailandense]|uniref:DUF3343 domain-containing protein n=1 Tax=Clostridium thailandense TaxID=2794346 RepID=A0A949THC8_9CLOT|nr:DUF3343 domain-containing protein [Clostridium thailandense]MBV7272814.1 DUF3343 domain-containing protein [Clostridium thailandense]MCH5137645.1 DUF3343 domain-containing protein [Clostridiaceae bacterium UIB06]
MKTEYYDYIMIFTSHHRALYMYERLIRKNIKVKLVNAPNKINISCTQAVKFKEIDIEVVQTELKRNNIYPTSIYRIMREGKNETYELVE